MASLQSMVLSAMLYADIFHYPLTFREIVFWVPSAKRIQAKSITKVLSYLVKYRKIQYYAPFFVLPRRVSLIGIRARHLEASRKKWTKAYTFARWVQWIPTVMLVGVTGGVAMNNADIDDDIDICIVARKKTVWITRFFVTLFAELMNNRRRPDSTHVKDKICLNMFLSETSLAVPMSERGLYEAHEVLQMVPLWERSSTYKKFVSANTWASLCYHNAFFSRNKLKSKQIRRFRGAEKICSLFESPARVLQLWYMNKRRTSEVVTKDKIRFHPIDRRALIHNQYRKLLGLRKIPLDKNLAQI